MKLEKSKTAENLQTAYLRESGAFNEYTFYARKAKMEGYEQVYRTFTEFANNEQAHATIWFNLFHGIKGTKENLLDAADLENFERRVMYSGFAKTAREEGFTEIASLFDAVAKIENAHEQTYKTLANKIENGEMFASEKEVTWKCLNCGHTQKGLSAPEKCPVCSHPKAYFTVALKQSK